MPKTVVYESPVLFPPDVITVSLEVGLVRSSDHVQWQLSAHSATDGVLLALEATPHRSMAQLASELPRMIDQLRAMLYDVSGPF